MASRNAKDLEAIQAEDELSTQSRTVLGKASRTRKGGWFKSVTWMEDVARDIVGPDLDNADAEFREFIEAVFAWANDGGG